MLKKIFKNSLIYGIGPQLPTVAGIISLPFITPFLTEVDFGIRGILLSYSGALIIFQTLGLKIVYANSFFHYPKQFKWLWRQLLGFELIWNLFFNIIFSIILWNIIPDEVGVNKALLIGLIIGPNMVLGPIANISILRYQLEERPLPIVIRTILFGLLNVTLVLYFIRVQKEGYLGWFLSTFITSLFSNLSYTYSTIKIFRITPIFNFKWRLIRKSLKVSIPSIPHYYSIYLLDSSDRIVMQHYNITTENIGK